MDKYISQKYGKFSKEQIDFYKEKMQKKIFWLILYTDKKTNEEYKDVDVVKYHKYIMNQLSGFNSIMMYPNELVEILSIMELALKILESDYFDFPKYRKLIFDAGALIKNMKVGD